MLDQTKPVQYVRISKIFLVDYDVNEAAKQKELMEYGNELLVTLTRIYKGIVQEVETLQIETSIPKDAGFFYSPNHILYKSTTLQMIADGITSYRLNIRNTAQVDGKNYEASAETKLINIRVNSLTYPGKSYNTGNSQTNFIGTYPEAYNENYTIKFFSGQYGALYNTTIRLHYSERRLGTNVFENKYADWNVLDASPPSYAGNEEMKTITSGYRFYEYFGNNIPVIEGVQRFADSLEYIVTVVDENIKTYMEVNKPSNGLVTDKPHFSNITNGMGIFGARTSIHAIAKTIITFDTKSGSRVYRCGLNLPSGDSLSCGALTKKLNFATFINTNATNGIDTTSCP